MRVIIYDKNPGKGLSQKFLMLSWVFAAYVQKLFGKVDRVVGVSSWDEAIQWMIRTNINLFTSIQYWGHGSPGNVWLNGVPLKKEKLLPLRNKLQNDSIVWFRTCSTFQGKQGQEFAIYLADTLGCIVAGHTRVIGLLQGSLYTLEPRKNPSWSIYQGEPRHWLPSSLLWGPRTITCFQTKIPKGW